MITALSSPVGSSDAARAAVDPKLANAAKQFETVLLSQWLQDAESSFASVPGGDSDTDAGSDQLKGLATQQLAASFTASGGVGISKLVLGALTKTNEKEQGAMHETSKTAVEAGGSAAMTGALAAYRAEAR